MKNRQAGYTQETSAAKVGISIRSGRRIEKGEHNNPKKRSWSLPSLSRPTPWTTFTPADTVSPYEEATRPRLDARELGSSG